MRWYNLKHEDDVDRSVSNPMTVQIDRVPGLSDDVSRSRGLWTQRLLGTTKTKYVTSTWHEGPGFVDLLEEKGSLPGHDTGRASQSQYRCWNKGPVFAIFYGVSVSGTKTLLRCKMGWCLLLEHTFSGPRCFSSVL